ncbi:MAG: galactose-1-phosphate uridylyltransferase [Candidatus Thermoplasmatota archaeon]|nr:galactose-1-phosphate uridylyltransferase [Candidatus Thermoplasmatota archaeon]
MPELRKDYVTDTWVVFSTWRSQRPVETKRQPSRPTTSSSCPFCPGNEQMTPPEIMAYRSDGEDNGLGWWVRCIPNKYPALTIDGEVKRTISQLLHSVNGVGAHEVIIETPNHSGSLPSLDEKQIYEFISAYRDRYVDLTRDARFKYILIFKNQGPEAGASLSHPHSQLIATPIIPRRIMDELREARNFYEKTGGSCIYDEIVEDEIEASERVVMETEDFLVLCPYASRFPFEVWILPKKHEVHFEEMSSDDRTALAKVMKDSFSRLDGLLNDPPFNYYIHTAPCDRKDHRYYHWHIEITPRLSKTAGFERGTGLYINPVPPEDAARLLREAPKGSAG